jgi:hypothetical protein
VAPGRPEASAAVWRWREARDEAGEVRRERLRARVGGLVGLVVSAFAFVTGHPTVALVAGSIGGAMLLASFVAPVSALASLRRLFERFGLVVGRLVAFLTLTPVFVLFFVPFGLLTRHGARDPLRRAFDRAAPSYWKKREGPGPSAERPF